MTQLNSHLQHFLYLSYNTEFKFVILFSPPPPNKVPSPLLNHNFHIFTQYKPAAVSTFYLHLLYTHLPNLDFDGSLKKLLNVCFKHH